MPAPEPALNVCFEEKLPSGNVLITARSGGFIVLTEKEYSLFKKEGPKNKKILARLEKECIMLTEKSAKKATMQMSEQYAFLSSPAMLCVVAITSKCNQSCIYCHANSTSGGASMDRKTIDEVVDFISALPHKLVGIDIQGGEPLLCMDEIKYFRGSLREKLKKQKKTLGSFVIVSNLSKMTEGIAKYILKEDIGLATSFDGPKSVHDAQRRLAGESSYDAVVKWVRYFRQFGKDVSMITTVTNASKKCGAKNIINECRSLGATCVNMRPAQPFGRAKEINIAPGPEEFFLFWKEGLEFMLEETLNGRIIYDQLTTKILANILSGRRTYMCFRMPCGAGISQLAFNPEGEILACDFARSLDILRLGEAGKSSYADILMNTLELRCTMPELISGCDTCVFSPYCGTCTCKNYAEGGELTPRARKSSDCIFNRLVFKYLFDALSDKKKRHAFESWITASKSRKTGE